MSQKTGQNISHEEIKSMVYSLRKTIVWTNFLASDFDYNQGNYGTVFRQTNPVINGTKLYKIEGNKSTWEIDDFSTKNYKKAIQILSSKKNEWISENSTLETDPNGRILVFLTQVTTHDGAPIVESNGFVDEGDIPPIDTWFFLKDKFYGHGDDYSDLVLFCWIPKKFEHQMQAAIDVEILDSYDWLDEINPTLNDEIMKYF